MEQDRKKKTGSQGIIETQLGPVGAGLPEIPEPAGWPSRYGIDEAVAIAVVPERALIFWELATLMESGINEATTFHLIRLRLEGEVPIREQHWIVSPAGRFQDSNVRPGREYLYVISRLHGDEEIPVMVTNPVRMPLRTTSFEPKRDLPSSITLADQKLQAALNLREEMDD